jgi:hypothetical protein
MTNKIRVDHLLIIFAIKLVQPCQINDVVEGIVRLIPNADVSKIDKNEVRAQLLRLRDAGIIRLYGTRRYMLTAGGEDYAGDAGLRLKIDARRMFLLGETRRARFQLRSDS